MKLDPDWLYWPQTQTLIAAFGRQPEALRFVGGVVRDALLGCEAHDLDAATTLLPEDTLQLLETARIRALPTGIAHGTITAIIGGKSFEITTLRQDVACDGRHAEVAFTGDWQADASRRDFTMNALYLAPDGTLFDYFGGVEDARAGRVRFIGDASARIAEDYLRILRFFRFYARYGQGHPDDAALAACVAGASHMASLSGERIQQELFKLFSAPAAYETLAMMQEKKILQHITGFAITDCTMFARFAAIASLENILIPHPVLLTVFMLKSPLRPEDALTKIATRLKLSNHAERMARLALQHRYDVNKELTEDKQKHLIRKLGGEDFTWAIAVNWASGHDAIDANHPYHAMLALAASWQAPAFPVRGDDLIALGLEPGKTMGAVLAVLEEEWEKSGYELSKEQLLTKARL